MTPSRIKKKAVRRGIRPKDCMEDPSKNQENPQLKEAAIDWAQQQTKPDLKCVEMV